MKSAGATLSGSTLSATAAGTVTVTATIVSGAAPGTDYTQDFEIVVQAPPVISNVTVSVSASPAEGGSVSGGGTYSQNAAVTVTAAAGSGWHFTQWTENGAQVSIDAAYAFTVTADRTLVAVFAANVPAGTALRFTSQPASQTVTAGATATFAAAAAGDPAPGYQWQVSTDGGLSWSDITDGTGASYTTPAATAAMNGNQYRCVATNTKGSAISSAVTLTVNSAPATTYPLTVAGGTGSGDYAPGTKISITADAPTAGKRFRAWELTSGGGTLADPARSSTTYTMPGQATTVTATYEAAIRIDGQPTDQYVTEGQRATFRITAVGDGLTCRWQIDRGDGRGWQPLPNGTGTSYTTTATLQDNDGYRYFCLLTDLRGNTLASDTAILHVYTAVVPPQTGDSAQPLLWLALCLLGGLGMAWIVGKKRKA